MSGETLAPAAAAAVQEQVSDVIVQDGNRVGSVKQQLSSLFEASLRATFPELNIEPMVAACTAKFGDYQCNNAMGIWSKLKGASTEFKNPKSIGQGIISNLPPSEMIESTSVAGPGFVNIGLSSTWMAQSIQNMLSNGIGTWAPLLPASRVLVDFSSPNIAKEMHVGHLRSTIIGDTLARMLEFSNAEVFRRNHVGDWGTQFGMLIQHLFETFPNWEDIGEQAIGDLQEFYKASKKRFDEDNLFKERAQEAVVRLQRSGVVFPNRSADSALIFTPPATFPTAIPSQIQANYGMPNNSSIRLDEAMASKMANLSLVDLDGIQTAMELLSEMLRAVNPSDHEAVKDEVIMDLVSQCRSNQKRILQLINATGDEELLGRALTLNDRLQSVLIKHEAIASGSPLPIEASASSPAPSAPLRTPSPVELNQIPIEEEEEDEDDEFIQLARRNEKFKQAATETSKGLETNGQLVPISTTATEAEASSSAISNALALPDPPAPVKTTKEQDMIDLLSLTLVTNPSSQPQTPLTPSSTASASSNGHGYSYNPQPYIGNQAYTPYNSYIAPWAQPLSPPLPPQSQIQAAQPLSPQPPLQPQVQVPQYESSYPPPPWATSTTYQVPLQAPIQQYQRNDAPAYNRFDHHQQVNANANQRAPMTGTPSKPYVPPYRLFEDLIDLRNPDGSVKVRNTPPSLSSARK